MKKPWEKAWEKEDLRAEKNEAGVEESRERRRRRGLGEENQVTDVR